MAEPSEFVVLGSGGHARVVVELGVLAGFNMRGVIDTDYHDQHEYILGFPIVGGLPILAQLDPNRISVGLAFGDNQCRAQYYEKIKNMGFHLPTICHPTAVISKHAKIGLGVLINTSAIINAGATIGDNSIINSGAIIEHEVSVGRHSHVGPGAKIGGRVNIGDKTLIGIGATVKNYINIGDCVTIGAGSVVIRNVSNGATVFGVPSRDLLG